MSKFIVETSARHIHLSKEDVETLFGAGKSLTHKKDLSQPGQFATEERLTVVGPKKELPNVVVLGPLRGATQVELSLTDARSIGISTFVKESGDIQGTAGCTLVGPAGKVSVDCGVIIAKRHIHMTPADAEKMGVTNKEIVQVKVESPERSLTFGDVVVRVSPDFALAMHIDTDEANAVSPEGVLYGEIVK